MGAVPAELWLSETRGVGRVEDSGSFLGFSGGSTRVGCFALVILIIDRGFAMTRLMV